MTPDVPLPSCFDLSDLGDWPEVEPPHPGAPAERRPRSRRWPFPLPPDAEAADDDVYL